MLGFIKSDGVPRQGEPPPFLPGLQRLQDRPPSPLPRRILYTLLALVAITALWGKFGRLDIVAVADGRLVPRTLVKIVQPAEAGIVREILVEEGAHVLAGQPLVRLDAQLAEADARALRAELAQRELQLRRLDAELTDSPLVAHSGDPHDAFARAFAQFRANRAAYADLHEQEAATVARITQELRAALEVETKLRRTAPIAQTMAERYAQLQREGFVSELFALERERDRIEKEQDLRAQEHTVGALRMSMTQAERRLALVTSNYRQQLHAERAQVEAQIARTREELAKQLYRGELVELRAPQAGIVKDLATQTIGAVVSPGAVMLTLVPHGEELQAEVMVRHEDAGFVHPGQRARVKIATYPFQKYGVLEGDVVRVSADAVDTPRDAADREARAASPSAYRARIALVQRSLPFESATLPLMAGMLVSVEIRLGDRSVGEYLLAPVQRAWHEAGRER